MKLIWSNEKRIVNDLIPFDKNPRQLSIKQKADLEKSLKKFGLVEIPVINTDNTIIAGHQRLKILQLLDKGYEGIDVRFPNRRLNKKEVEEYNVRSNKNTGDWDYDILANEFELDDLLEWGFTEDELAGFEDDVEEVEPMAPNPKSVISQRGEIYRLGKHRLMCGDSLKSTDVKLLMGNIKSDMVFTDPPYGMDFSGSVHGDGKKSQNAKYGKIKGDAKPDDQFLNDFVSILKEFNQGAFYITYWRLGIDTLMNALTRGKLKWRSLIIWRKNNFTLSNSDYKSRYEPVVFGWADDYEPILYGWAEEHDFVGRKGSDDIWEIPTVWDIDRTQVNELHPTMKPIALCARAIYNSSRKGQVVLDLFGGSGSTLIACEQVGRICYMMELDPVYCDVIRKRYAYLIGKEDSWQKATPKL